MKTSAGDASNIDWMVAVGSAETGIGSGLKAMKEVQMRERSEQLRGVGLAVREREGTMRRWRDMEI